MKNITLHNLELLDDIITPEQFIETSVSSPATDFFTDFKSHYPLMIEDSTLATEALKLMRKTHVQMKIVVSNNNDFLGIISTKELTERHIMQRVSKGESRDELTIADMMVHRKNLYAFDYKDIKKTSVGHVMDTLKNYGLRHCLVVDKANHHIRGVISSSDIARKLRLPIEINAETSFSGIFNVLHC